LFDCIGLRKNDSADFHKIRS